MTIVETGFAGCTPLGAPRSRRGILINRLLHCNNPMLWGFPAAGPSLGTPGTLLECPWDPLKPACHLPETSRRPAWHLHSACLNLPKTSQQLHPADNYGFRFVTRTELPCKGVGFQERKHAKQRDLVSCLSQDVVIDIDKGCQGLMLG